MLSIIENTAIRPVARRTHIFAIALVAASLTAPAIWSQPQRSWTTVGSAGTVDESSAAYVVYGTGPICLVGHPCPSNPTMLLGDAVFVADAAPVETSVRIRYNVVAVDGLFTAPGDYASTGVEMKVRF